MLKEKFNLIVEFIGTFLKMTGELIAFVLAVIATAIFGVAKMIAWVSSVIIDVYDKQPDHSKRSGTE